LDVSNQAWNFRRIAERALLAFACLMFALLSRYHWHQICDDAFIAFRYADHVVAGLGPVWNRGEAVEGYSSPLWLGLLVLGRAAGIALPLWSGVLGVFFSALCLVFVHRLAFALSDSRLVAAGACAAASLLYPIYYWAPAGLETALYAALITAATWSLLARSTWAWALLAACLGVARPEGPFLACALVGLAALAKERRVLRPGRICLALGPALAWIVFRRAFYGDWLPNTYYAKATGSLVFRLEAGLGYAIWAAVGLAVTAVATWLAGMVSRKGIAAILFLALALAAVIVGGGDWMWHGRMLAPVLPALVGLAAAALARAPSQRRPVLVLVYALALSVFLPRPALLADALVGKRLPPTAYQEGTMIPAALAAAQFIAAKYPADALVAVNHAGALPYALPNPVLDMTGLADRHIAHEVEGSLHEKFDPAYVLARKPRLVVLNSRTRPGAGGAWYHVGYWVGETALVAQPELRANYRPVDTFWEWRWLGDVPSYILLFERVDKNP
jgi:hypothetical protein